MYEECDDDGLNGVKVKKRHSHVQPLIRVNVRTRGRGTVRSERNDAFSETETDHQPSHPPCVPSWDLSSVDDYMHSLAVVHVPLYFQSTPLTNRHSQLHQPFTR